MGLPCQQAWITMDNLFLQGDNRDSFVKIINTLPENSPWHRLRTHQHKSIGESFLCATCTSMVHHFFSNGTYNL